MTRVELSLTEWVVLALVGESATHGFAIARQLQPDSDLGRILTVHRPLVYRALGRLRDHRYVEDVTTQPGAGGPNRVVVRITRSGRRRLGTWFTTPVQHVRELRIEFLLKLRLIERSGRDPHQLIAAQRNMLANRLDVLAADDPGGDVVDRWRRHNAAAARAFLESL